MGYLVLRFLLLAYGIFDINSYRSRITEGRNEKIRAVIMRSDKSAGNMR